MLGPQDWPAMIVVEHVSGERPFEFLTVLVENRCLLLLLFIFFVAFGLTFAILVTSISLFVTSILFFSGFCISLGERRRGFAVCNATMRAAGVMST